MRRLDLKKTQAARLNTIRGINRQIVLNYVREREPISRAEIARETELQRSTISEIVDSLRNDGLIEEIGAGESTGGRRPTLLRLRTEGPIAIGVAITPTSTWIASCDLSGRLIEQEEFPTDPDWEITSQRIISSVKTISNNRGSIEAVGITVPGLVDPAGVAIYVPYFKWRGIPIADVISRGTGLPVRIDNDANSIALAELWFGRPEISDARDFIMILVAEGVGTGIIIDGQVYRGERGAAGEFGHMIVGSQAPLACSCGNFDCWEAFASEGSALARYRKLCGDRPEDLEVTFPELIDMALAGEENASKAIAETAHYLGIGISNLIVGFSPEVVIVSGEITRAWSMVEMGLGETIERSIRRGLPSARITASTLGDQPTLMGALSLVLASKFAADFAA